MKFCYNKVALLVLSFCTLTAFADHGHHAHDHNHGGKDVLSTLDQNYHDYHHHHPVQPASCGQVCPRSISKFGAFEVGQVYTVDVEGETLLDVKEGVNIGLKTKADVQVLSPCEFTLTLRQSQVTGVPDTQKLNQQLDTSPPLRFGAHDGQIFGVCPEAQEGNWTLNVKKSILSAMQITTKDLSATQTVEEVDFSGHCTTTYKPLTELDGEGKNVLIEKTKNLNKCHLRRKNLSGFNSKALTLLTEFIRENLPILAGTQTCIQEIKNGHMFSVVCTEEHTLTFKSRTVVKSTLKLRSAGKAPATKVVPPGAAPQTAQSLLLSRGVHTEKVWSESEVLTLLRTVCAQVSGDTLEPVVTETFHTLVHALTQLPEAVYKSVNTASKTGEICQSPKVRQLFISASAFAASDPAIQTLIAEYNNKEYTPLQMTLLINVAAQKTRSSEKTIESMVALIEAKDTARQLILSTSIMVRNFCKKTENCDQLPAVKKTTSALLLKLQKSDCNLERITILKALDNIRPKTDTAVKTTLLALAQDSSADIGVRVAAIQALHCCADDGIRQKLIELLKKTDEPSEVRITAYRTVIESGATVEQLESILSVTDTQIQNFIRSHIKNLKQSSNQNRRNLVPTNAPAFENPKTPGWGMDRNLVYNYKNAIIEADVVHPKHGSLVPSLLTFGVSFPFRGKDIQLLEIEFRQQGLDTHLKKIIAKGLSGPELLVQLSEELLELRAFLKDPDHKHSVTVQLSVRMSGRNILFVDTFEDLHTVLTLLKTRARELYNKDTLDMAWASQILDSEVEVPTINGFPMVIHLNETVVIGLNAQHSWTDNGGSKTRRISSSRTILDETSAGINLKVAEFTPGFVYQLRFAFTPSSDGLFEKLENGKVLKARINLPDGRKTLMRLHQSVKLIDAYGLARPSNEINTGPTTLPNKCRQIFGLNVCRDVNYVGNSPIPNVEYYFSKEDPTLDALEFTLERPGPSDTKELMVWSAKVNAGKREYLAQLEIKNGKKVQLKLQSPRRTVTFDGELNQSQNGNASKLELDFKVPERINLNTKINTERVGDQRNIEVLAEYQLAGAERKETVKWTRKSSMNYSKNKKTKQINLSYFGEFQSTQFPTYNSKVTYYTNWRPYQNSKTDFTVEWGPQLKDLVRVQHISKMDVIELRPFQMISENNLIVEATPLDINYDFKLNSDISMLKNKPKLVSLDLVGKDVLGRPDRDVRGSIRYESVEQQQPRQQTINASLSYPGRDMTYYSEVKQIKDFSFEGKMIFSKQKGQTVTVEHKESITNPTKDFHFDSEAEVSYSWSPAKYKLKTEVGWHTPNQFEYKHSYTESGKKENEVQFTYDKNTAAVTGHAICNAGSKQTEFKVDNIFNPRSAQWGIKSGIRSYKFSAVRVPKESIEVKLDSVENSRYIKDLKIKVSRKEKSTLKLVTNDDFSLNTFVDPFGKDFKQIHAEFNCKKHGIVHTGDIILYSKPDRKLTWNSQTLKNGNTYLTLESQFAPKERSFIILKKIDSSDSISKFEYFRERGVYAATLDTKSYSAMFEGENRDSKRFGKVRFVDKVGNFEHQSQFNITNGVLTIKSISDKEKETFTKLDAVLGRRIVSNLSLITPNRNAQLTINPLGEKKTLVFNYVSTKYDQTANLEWVPHKYLKVDTLSQRKVEPQKRVKVDAYLTKYDEANFKLNAGPDLQVDIKRVKTPKPQYIFNTTINGYNEVQEFESDPTRPPIYNFYNALQQYLESYYQGQESNECRLTDWTQYSSCSVTCGQGIRIRTRKFIDANQQGVCKARLMEEENCEVICINGVSCATTEWSNWNSCSALCGKGFSTRTRKFINSRARIVCRVELIEKRWCMGTLAKCPK